MTLTPDPSRGGDHRGMRTARVVVVIPARGGSKGVPGKNLAPVGGVPLVARAVRSALAARLVDEVIVSTDDPRIAEVAADAGARILSRPAALAGDEASSESAVLHALAAREDGVDPEVVVLLQCTSPFIDPDDLDSAIRRVLDDEADVALAVTPTYDFIWAERDGRLVGVNHDCDERLRRQDRQPSWRETGAFYVMRTAGLHLRGHRFFGRVVGVPVASAGAIEIDEPDDLAAAQLCAGFSPAPSARLPLAVDVDAVVTDFDGVHTDNTVCVDSSGTESVRVSRADGLGIAALRRAGVPVLILSTETDPVVQRRAAKLGVECISSCADKGATVRAWMDALGLAPGRVAFVGNDLNDLPGLAAVGWPIAVADAHPDVIAASRLVLLAPGGHGAVRELATLVLASKGTLA